MKDEFFELLCNFEKVLATEKCYNAMNLSWKLFLIDCKGHLERDNVPAIWTKYNDIYCVYRDILIRVWDKKGNPKVNLILDEINAFANLDLFMQGFEFNMINNLYVPTEAELQKYIDVSMYQDQLKLVITQDSRTPRLLGSDDKSNSPVVMKVQNQTAIKDPFNFNMNEVTENIMKLPVKSVDAPKFTSGSQRAHAGDNSPSKEASRDLSAIPKQKYLNNEDNHLQPNQIEPLASIPESKKDEVDLASKEQKPETSKDLEAPEQEHPAVVHKKSGHVLSLEHTPSAATNKSLDRLLELEAWDVSEWEEAHKSEFIQIYKRKEEDSPVILIKAYSLMRDIPPEKVFRLIYDLNIRSEWDNVLSNMRIFGKINENVDHMYSLFKAPIGISNRDFCQKRTKSMGYKNTSFIIHFESVEHQECPPIKGTIRAHTYISGYIIRPSHKYPGSSEMTILTQTDIKGLLPKMIVNMAAAKAPSDWCKNFKKNADRLIKAGKL